MSFIAFVDKKLSSFITQQSLFLRQTLSCLGTIVRKGTFIYNFLEKKRKNITGIFGTYFGLLGEELPKLNLRQM